MSTLAQDHDCLLLDLDGTVFRGHEPTPGAVDTLAAVRARTLFVTNNASRGAAEVAQHLREMGFTAKPDDIVTSAQTAARLLQEQLQPGAAVLVVGTDALAAHTELGELLPADGGDCEEVIAKFSKAGIDVDALDARLQDEGAESFVKSWNELMAVISSKSATLAASSIA